MMPNLIMSALTKRQQVLRFHSLISLDLSFGYAFSDSLQITIGKQKLQQPFDCSPGKREWHRTANLIEVLVLAPKTLPYRASSVDRVRLAWFCVYI